MRITIDTNVLARAAFSPGGPARAVVELVTLPPHVLVLSHAILDELRRVLRYPRLRALHGFDDSRIDEEVDALHALAHIIVPTGPVAAEPVVAADPADDVIVAVAVLGRADTLCTLDRHLHSQKVKEYAASHGLRILRDVELLDELRT